MISSTLLAGMFQCFMAICCGVAWFRIQNMFCKHYLVEINFRKWVFVIAVSRVLCHLQWPGFIEALVCACMQYSVCSLVSNCLHNAHILLPASTPLSLRLTSVASLYVLCDWSAAPLCSRQFLVKCRERILCAALIIVNIATISKIAGAVMTTTLALNKTTRSCPSMAL